MTETPDPQLQLKKRARRRLVGAIAFAGLAAVILPMVMDEEPKQPAQNVQIRIPGQEQAPFNPKELAAKAVPPAAVVAASVAGAGQPDHSEPSVASETPAVVAETPASKPAEKKVVKPVERVPEKTAEKVVAKPVAKPVEKVAEKTAEKATDKRGVKPAETAKAVDKQVGKPADKKAEKAPEKPSEKKPEKAPDKPPEKAPSKKVDKPVEKAPEAAGEDTGKPATDDAAHVSPSPASKTPDAGTSKAGGQQVIMIGAFANPENAKQLQGKIGAAGVSSYTEILDTPDGKKTRVRAGPFPNREAAEKALEKLRKVGVTGVVAGSR